MKFSFFKISICTVRTSVYFWVEFNSLGTSINCIKSFITKPKLIVAAKNPTDTSNLERYALKYRLSFLLKKLNCFYHIFKKLKRKFTLMKKISNTLRYYNSFELFWFRQDWHTTHAAISTDFNDRR